MKKKVCVVVNSRANYGRIKSFLIAARENKNLELFIVAGASALLYRFGEVIKEMKKDSFAPDIIMHSAVEGRGLTPMAKTTGLSIIEMATILENSKPDIVLTVADRYETLSTAVAASYMNILVAHTQGGEVTGSIDENVRHAITKLSHIHFPATSRAKDFLIRMGEEENRIFLTGCPAMDLLKDNKLTLPKDIFTQNRGVGAILDSNKEYIICLQHPVTTEYLNVYLQIEETLKAIKKISLVKPIQFVFLWPNIDAGSDEISKRIRQFREVDIHSNIQFFKNFSPLDYACLLNNCSCIMGNSSSGIREASFLGVPSVNIGNRQIGRERGINVIDVPHNSELISEAVLKQIKTKRFPSSKIFGDGTAGYKIAKVLSENDFQLIKRLNYLEK